MDSVVNSSLQVHGVAGLSVCDASVMPSIVSANTNAATMMIGLAGATMIGQRLSSSSSSSPLSSSSRGYHTSRRSTAPNVPSVRVAIGFDFGTESVRAVLVDIDSGDVLGDGTSVYSRGQITSFLPSQPSPPETGAALQGSQ